LKHIEVGMKSARFPEIIRILFALAALWALLAGLVILLIPMGTRVTETLSSSGASETTVRQLSWFESQGWWGIWILVAFAALYYGPFHFFRRGSRALAALFAVAAILITVLAGFSVGLFYVPAAIALLIGLVLLLSSYTK
jgi:hypothetical protein